MCLGKFRLPIATSDMGSGKPKEILLLLTRLKLRGKHVGIDGLGSIGFEVAKRLEAFGCTISYNSRSKKPSIAYPFDSNVKEFAASNDIIILCCSLTGETHHMVNKEVLSALGKEGVIVNVGRGTLIDEKELVRCLVGGDIRGAGLDVFENGSNVPEEFFQLDNVVLTPHTAVCTPESFENAVSVMIANLEAFFLNKLLLIPVTKDSEKFV